MKKTHTVWSNEWDEIKAIAKDLAEDNGGSPKDYYEQAQEISGEYLDDERINLNINTNQIIAIADLGFWNGRKSGYKEVGYNIKDCLYSNCDICHFYCDGKDFKATMTHHDGTNYIVYRERKDNVSDTMWERLKDLIYEGEASWEDILKCTKSLRPRIKAVYGW